MAYFRCGGGVPSSVKTLPTYKTASGSVATFETDMTENLISCVCDFSAIQASGTPSPSTPLPISGVSAVNVTACGINTWDEQWEQGTINDTTGQPTGSTTQMRSANFCSCLPDTNYYVYVGSHNPIRVFWYDGQGTYLGQTVNIDNTVVTAPNTARYFKIRSTNAYGNTYLNDISINNPSTDTTYHAYTGTTATCNLGDTYYGGSVDVVTGKIILTHKIVELDENWYWFKGGTQPTGRTVITTTNFPSHIADDEFSSHFVKTSSPYIVNMAYGDFMLSATGVTGYFCYKNSDDGTVEEFKQFIVTQRNNGTPVQVWYKLDNPIVVYANNSLEIPTINGTNNLFADTGDINCKYILSVGEALRQG